MLDRLTESVIAGEESISNIASTFGQKYADIIQERLDARGYVGSAKARSLVMQWQREDRKRAQQRMQELVAAGCAPYSPKQEVFTAALRVHLDGCESGEYPTAWESAKAVAGDKALKLLAKPSKKRISKAIQENKEHPGMRRIRTVADHSTITAMASGSVSSCLGALANSHKLARRLERIESKAAELEARLFRAEEEAARANARLDIKDLGQDWKEAARAIRAVEPGITNTALGLRVGKSEGAIRKYLNSLEA